MKKILTVLLSMSLFLIVLSCKNDKNTKGLKIETSEIDELGKLHFPTTGSELAQEHFRTGVLLLHSFEYDDSRAAFLRAQEADPNHAMSYWGEAMTYNHALWQRQEKDKAIAALEKLSKSADLRLTKVVTPLEKDIFQGIEILYGQGTKYDRDVAYSEYMKQLTSKYPDNHEISAFYAISLLGASRNGRDNELYGKCAQIVQGIIDENPNHPGALHYLIHSYDDPVHAHLAKSAADSYSKVAPDATHALHMPSHIYVALGSWEDVITSNIASWNASVKRMRKKELDDTARSYHAYNWLQYGLLQRGETDAAQSILDNMVQYVTANPTKQGRGYLTAMKGAQMVESNNWTNANIDISVDTDDLNITKRSGHAFIEGMTAYENKEIEMLAEIINKMAQDRINNAQIVGEKGFAMCNANGYNSKLPSQMDIDMAHVMEMELKAYYSDLKGDKAAAEDWFKKGVALDETLNYSYGPPTILKPVHEAYAQWLLENDMNDEASLAFDKALNRNPRRLLSLKGKMDALKALNDNEAIARIDNELKRSLEYHQWNEIL